VQKEKLVVDLRTCYAGWHELHYPAEFHQPKRCSCSTACFVLLSVTASVLLAGVSVFGTTNHPPSVSWIKDQAITDQNNNLFDTVYFRAWDNETPIGVGNLSYVVENDIGSPNFYSGSVYIDTCSPSDNGCPQDGIITIEFVRSDVNPFSK
jgi:hypothetical protein